MERCRSGDASQSNISIINQYQEIYVSFFIHTFCKTSVLRFTGLCLREEYDSLN
jgi:hypothetical protein